MLAAFPADHPMVRGRPRKRIALSELAEESFILYRRHNGPGLYDAVISACAAAGFSPRMAQEAPRMLSTLSRWPPAWACRWCRPRCAGSISKAWSMSTSPSPPACARRST